MKKVIITGATGGIGEAIAEKFAAIGGYQLLLTGRNEDKLGALSQKLAAEYIALDLTDKEAAEQLINKLGGVDVLVCNAGITRDNLMMRMKDEEWSEVIESNLTAVFRLIRASLKGMMKQRFGRIINISSVVGFTGNAGQVNYCASKAGMVGMSKALALEVATRGITVNCIAPGFIRTNMTDGLNDAQKEKILQNIPMQKMGESSDIAAAAAFLASDDASYITGQTIHINGGLALI